MNSEFNIECPICDIETVVVVKYEEEIPRHCPMCGSDVEAEQVDED